MTLTDLRYLAALADHGHFGRAAAACRVSQSTLSMAIRRLEKNLGITLFERARSGITATADGEKVLTHARRALAHAQAITTLASHSDNPLAEPLTLGDRKSTRLNSSHVASSYAVFCLKKKNN